MMKVLSSMVWFVSGVAAITLMMIGTETVVREYHKEKEMAQMWAAFLEVPKDYRESTQATAETLVRGWEVKPTAEQRELIEREIAPRVNHIYASNGQMSEKMFEHWKPVIEYRVSQVR